MANLSLYRKRFIPNEIIPLKDDVILYQDEDIIVTGWHSLHPKEDLHHGYSCCYLKKGWKVSKFLLEDDSLLCWYIDIVEYDMSEPGRLVITDLLADVIIRPGEPLKVVDLDELAEAAKKEYITPEQLYHSLEQLNELLTELYEGRLDTLTAPVEKYISHHK